MIMGNAVLKWGNLAGWVNISDTRYNETDTTFSKIRKELDLFFRNPAISVAASVEWSSDEAVAQFQIFYSYGFKKNVHNFL